MDNAMTSHSPEWYNGRRVFVTGHTGFKGAWLCLWLQKLGAHVTGYALPADEQSLYAQADVESGMTSVISDIRDRKTLESALRGSDPEVIFHMAAQSLVRRSYDSPVETFETNLMGTVNILDTARTLPSMRSIVVVTSDKCYENKELGIAFTEEAAMGGADPYSASKGCTELATASYARSFFSDSSVVLSTARAGNVIGGCDWAEDRIIPDLMRALAAKTTVNIRRPGATRPWQHVLEPLRGYLMLAMRGAEGGNHFSGGWNFGPHHGDVADVRTIVDNILKTCPNLDVSFATHEDGPHEAHHLGLNCVKAATELDWQPVLSLADAITMTIEIYQTAMDKPNMLRASTLNQIQSYEERFQSASLETQHG